MAEEHKITSLKGLEDLRFGSSRYFKGADFSSPRARGSSRFGGDYVSLPDRLKPLGDLTLQSPLECLLLRWEAVRRMHAGSEVSDDLMEALNKPQSTRMLIAYFLAAGDLFAALDDCPSSYALFSKAAELEIAHRRTCTFSIAKTPWVTALLVRAKQEGRIVNMDSWLDNRYHSRLPFPLSTSAAGVSEFSANIFCQAMFGGATVLYEALEQEYAAAGLIHLSIPWKGSLEYRSDGPNSDVVLIHTVILGGLQDSGLPVNVTNPHSKDRYSLSAVNANAFVRDRGCMRGVRNPASFSDYQKMLKDSLRPALQTSDVLIEVIPPGSKAGLTAKPVGR